jgi:hypothetical protein
MVFALGSSIRTRLTPMAEIWAKSEVWYAWTPMKLLQVDEAGVGAAVAPGVGVVVRTAGTVVSRFADFDDPPEPPVMPTMIKMIKMTSRTATTPTRILTHLRAGVLGLFAGGVLSASGMASHSLAAGRTASSSRS